MNSIVTSPPYWGLRDYGVCEVEGSKQLANNLIPGMGLACNEYAPRLALIRVLGLFL